MTKMKGFPIVQLKLTPDLHRMVFVNSNSTIVVFDFESNKVKKQKVEKQPTLLSMVPGKQMLLTCDDSNTIHFYDSVTLEAISLKVPDFGKVNEVCASHNFLAFAT